MKNTTRILLHKKYGFHDCLMIGMAVLTATLGMQVSAKPIEAEFAGTSFLETVSNDVVVSGAVVVGIVDAAPLDGKAVSTLAISPGALSSRLVCLSVISSDGVYSASNQFEIPRSYIEGQVVTLPYKYSQHLPRLAEYADTEVAVKASAGLCGAQTTDAYVVYRYGAPRPAKIRLYVNSINATDIYWADGNQAGGDCQRVKGRNTSFDFSCDIDWSTHAGKVGQVFLEREVYGRSLGKVTLTIAGGG
ncbi:hypothetical protein H0A66_05605 [Alcaligenaceae bacterium]|nr:hypothetical protein [Alcaligenaceae bacterium]